MTYKNYVTQNTSKIRLKTMSSDNITPIPFSMAKGGRDVILQFHCTLIKFITLVAISKRYHYEKIVHYTHIGYLKVNPLILHT